MAIIVPLQNITRLDLPPDRVLQEAVGELEGVILLGYDKEGEEYFASTYANGADVLWLLERCKQKLLNMAAEDSDGE